MLAALEEETKKRLDAERAATEHATELAQLKEEGQKVATFLQFDEETTRRRLIDQALIAAGWNVGANGTNTEQVRQEVRLVDQPTPTRQGLRRLRSLWRRRQAARRHRGEEDGEGRRARAREQARQYADGLEKETGERPVIFYTNGIDIFLWDDAQGYPLPQGLRLLLEGQPRVPGAPAGQQEGRSPTVEPEPRHRRTACTSSRRSSGSASGSPPSTARR